MIPHDEILSMARAAGIEVHPRKQQARVSLDELTGCDSTDKLVRFAELAITRHLAHSPPAPIVVSMSDVGQAQLASMLANHQPMPLVVAPDGSELAACFDQIKSELIADGAVEHDLGLEFFPEAVLDAFRRQRAARQEAQQRLADAQELAARSGLAHRKAVQEAVSDAMKRMQAGEKLSYTDKEVELIMLGWQSELQKAVAAEREALRETLSAADVLAVNFMRAAGIDKHAARQCADVVRELVANHAAGGRARGAA